MADSKKKTNFVLWTVTAGLLVLFLLSFTKTASSDKRKPVKTAFLNPKNIESVNYFEISSENESLVLLKNNHFWTVSSENKNEILLIDSTRIQKFINELSSTRVIYKVSESIGKKNNFGLTDGSEIHIKYRVNDTVTDLIFGKNDFSKASRYFMTGRSAVVYEIDDSFDKYLNLSLQNWAEPYLVSRQALGIIKADDIQSISINFGGNLKRIAFDSEFYSEYVNKLLELRHGGIGLKEDKKNITAELNIELGNKSKIILNIFESSSENEFIVEISYFDNLSGNTIQTISKISLWTFNKLVM